MPCGRFGGGGGGGGGGGACAPFAPPPLGPALRKTVIFIRICHFPTEIL